MVRSGPFLPMNAVLILNPNAGQRKPEDTLGQVEWALRDKSLHCEVIPTQKSGHGTEIARQAVADGRDLVIAAGGDGTVNEVATALVGTGVPLGIIPLGTVNVLARELRIPFDLRKAVRTIVDGNVRKMDVGCVGEHYFTLMAGFGFDAEITATVVQPLKDVIGASAYVIKTLEMLARYEATDVTLEMAEETYNGRAYMVVVANSPSYAYKLSLAPYASTEDGLLDVIVFEQLPTKRMGFLQQILQIFIRRHVHHRAVRYFKTPKVTVRSNPEVMIQIDGDPNGMTPAEVSIVPCALSVLVPRG